MRFPEKKKAIDVIVFIETIELVDPVARTKKGATIRAALREMSDWKFARHLRRFDDFHVFHGILRFPVETLITQYKERGSL